MRVALTGATGFIGRALVRRALERKVFEEIRVLTRRPASAALPAGVLSFQGDLAEDRGLAEFVDGVDVLIHCAGEWRDAGLMAPLHIGGTKRLIEAASGRVARWVQLSSVGAYGKDLREGEVREDSPLAPAGTYEETKAAADGLVLARGDVRSVLLRPSIVFGPGMGNRSLYQLVSAIDRGLFFHVGHQAVANYVYVDDVADALIACAVAPAAHGIYVLSDDRPMEQFVASIARELGRSSPRLHVPEWLARTSAAFLQGIPGFPLTTSRVDVLSRRVRYPSARIRRELSFSFGVSVETGLRRFIEDWKSKAL